MELEEDRGEDVQKRSCVCIGGSTNIETATIKEERNTSKEILLGYKQTMLDTMVCRLAKMTQRGFYCQFSQISHMISLFSQCDGEMIKGLSVNFIKGISEKEFCRLLKSIGYEIDKFSFGGEKITALWYWLPREEYKRRRKFCDACDFECSKKIKRKVGRVWRASTKEVTGGGLDSKDSDATIKNQPGHQEK